MSLVVFVSVTPHVMTLVTAALTCQTTHNALLHQLEVTVAIVLIRFYLVVNNGISGHYYIEHLGAGNDNNTFDYCFSYREIDLS